MYTRFVISLAVVGITLAAPNHLKTVVVEKQVNLGGAPSAAVASGGLGASASWGPFSAGAGLGGGSGGGGLYAGASSPQGSAGAGLGGGSSGGASSSASASASASAGGGATAVGGHPQQQGGSFFDKIFNIPISILQSVNQNLNANGVPAHHYEIVMINCEESGLTGRALRKCLKRGGIKKRVYVQGNVGGGAQAGANAGANAGGNAGANAGANASANGGAGANASAGASADAGVQTRSAGAGATASAAAGSSSGQIGVTKNYDAVFNIPITALRSVNEFLNSGK